MSWTAEMVEKELSQRADALDETVDVKLFETVMEQTTCYFKVGNFERALDRSMELSAIATKALHQGGGGRMSRSYQTQPSDGTPSHWCIRGGQILLHKGVLRDGSRP